MDIEYLHHPSFQLLPRVFVVPWGQQDLVLQEDLLHLCIHVYPWVLKVYYFQVIPQHPLDSRVLGIQGCREFQLHNTEFIYKNQFLRLLFLELQSNSSLRTFATDMSLVRTLMRTTETCFFAQSTDFRNAVTSLSNACSNTPFLLEGKKPLVDGYVDVSFQRYSTPDRMICRRKLDYFGIK